MELKRIEASDREALLKAYYSFKKSDPDFSFLFYFDPDVDFEKYQKILSERELGIELPDNHVPGTFLVAWEGKDVVGRVSIRHKLNDFLLNVGGHIGYGVVKEHRKKGYATQILREGLKFCKNELKLSRVLVTCDDDNVGSIKTIERNGGVLENTYNGELGQTPTRRYWIDLT